MLESRGMEEVKEFDAEICGQLTFDYHKVGLCKTDAKYAHMLGKSSHRN